MKTNREIYELCVQRRYDDISKCLDGGMWQADTYVVDDLGTKFSLLVCAAQDGAIDLAKTLLDHGANPNGRIVGAQTALMCASAAGHDAVVELLLRLGADVHKKCRGESVLMAAASQNRMDVIRRLLNVGARVGDKDGKGRTALSHAVTRADVDPEIINILVNAGSPVDGRDLNVPVARRELSLVKLLLSAGPDVNATFDWLFIDSAPVTKGDAPLHVAAGDTFGEAMIKSGSPFGVIRREERIAIVELLLAAGADVDAQRPRTGVTPLLLATNADEPEIAALLIQAGADPHREFECKVLLSPLTKPQTFTPTTLSAVKLAQTLPQNARIRKLLLDDR